MEEFEEAVNCEAEVNVMVESLVESEGELLTNDLDAVGELLEAWDAVVDTSLVEGDFVWCWSPSHHHFLTVAKLGWEIFLGVNPLCRCVSGAS